MKSRVAEMAYNVDRIDARFAYPTLSEASFHVALRAYPNTHKTWKK